MILVVVILGILAAIAIPQYNDYITKARLTDATSQLSSYKTQMEQFYADNRTYAGATLWGNPPVACNTSDETAISRDFDFICQAVANGIMEVSLRKDIPVIFGVLTTNNQEQALDRSGGKHGNKGVEAAITALKMASL